MGTSKVDVGQGKRGNNPVNSLSLSPHARGVEILLVTYCYRNWKCMYIYYTVWLAPWTGKMNRILRCDWLPEWACWRYFVKIWSLFTFKISNNARVGLQYNYMSTVTTKQLLVVPELFISEKCKVRYIVVKNMVL